MTLASGRFGNDERLQSAARNNPPLRQGTTGKSVETLQRALVELGFAMPISTHGGAILGDGIFGSETAKAVKTFQSQQGLDSDGIAGHDTLHRLDQIYSAIEAAKTAKQTLDIRSSAWL